LATLSVLKFDDPYGAERVLIALQGMQERQMLTLEDVAVVSWPQGVVLPRPEIKARSETCAGSLADTAA
jgi:uncharacterized membrane protein